MEHMTMQSLAEFEGRVVGAPVLKILKTWHSTPRRVIRAAVFIIHSSKLSPEKILLGD